MGIALAIIGTVIFFASIIYKYYYERKICKDMVIKTLVKKDWILIGSLVFASGLGVMLAFIGAFVAYPSWTDGRAGHMAMAALGGFFFGFGLSALFSGFSFRYRESAIEEKTKKFFSIVCLASILPIFAGLIVFGEGFAPYQEYPLPCGITFVNGVLKLYSVGEASGSFRLTFYGLIIVSGVFVVYCVCDRQFYLKYKKHNILDNLVLIAFPCGIIGARIWYVVGNWERMFKNRPFTDVFAIWDGGLTILGGAAFGALAGILFIIFRRKYVQLSFAMDVCIPSILIAQAIGRWGNFFNCEVYGKAVELSNGWQWLPTWIANQMAISNSGSMDLSAGQIHAPLFLIEGMVNLAGYFIIRFGIGKGLKKWLKGGELAASYFIWYGIVRFIMEPFRDTDFNMGTDNAWSIINSLMYIVIGVGMIAIIHLLSYDKKENSKGFVTPLIGGGLAILGTALLAAPSVSVGKVITSSEVEYITSYSGFDMIFGQSDAIHLSAWILMLVGGALLIVGGFLKKWKTVLTSVSMAFFLTSTILFLGGSKWVNPSSATYSYSNSYGFAIYAMIGVFAMVIGIIILLPTIQGAIKKKKESKNA